MILDNLVSAEYQPSLCFGIELLRETCLVRRCRLVYFSQRLEQLLPLGCGGGRGTRGGSEETVAWSTFFKTLLSRAAAGAAVD